MKIRKYGIFYFAVFFAAFELKYHFGRAGSNELIWLLAPTARWVKNLSGIAFVYEPGIGYVSESLRFIIAPSCAGIRFLMICMLMLVCSFVHRMRTWKRGAAWTVFSLFSSYQFTVLVNGIRIVLSLYIPEALRDTDICNGWLTPERLHTVLGTTIYFAALFVIFRLADTVSHRLSGTEENGLFCKYAPPVFWYFIIVLGIPFLNRVFRKDYKNFTGYAFLVTAACMAVLCISFFISWLLKKIKTRRKHL